MSSRRLCTLLLFLSGASQASEIVSVTTRVFEGTRCSFDKPATDCVALGGDAFGIPPGLHDSSFLPGLLSASVESHGRSGGLVTAMYEIFLIVRDGPESDYIFLDGHIHGTLSYNGDAIGRAHVTSMLGDLASHIDRNFLPAPSDIATGGITLERLFYKYERGVAFPFSIALEASAQDGGVADAVSAFGFHFEEGNGLERERFATRPLGGIHYEAIHMPEPGTLRLGLAGMLVVGWKVWRRLASKG